METGLEKALKTVDIKGKAYVTVNERIKYFREHFTGYRLLSEICLLYTSPSPRDRTRSRMPSSA